MVCEEDFFVSAESSLVQTPEFSDANTSRPNWLESESFISLLELSLEVVPPTDVQTSEPSDTNPPEKCGAQGADSSDSKAASPESWPKSDSDSSLLEFSPDALAQLDAQTSESLDIGRVTPLESHAIESSKPKISSPQNCHVSEPFVPLSELSLEVLVPARLILIRDYWPEKMCQKLLDLLRTLRMKNVEGKVKEGEPRHSLDTLTVMLETFTHKLWYRTGLKELVEGDRDKVESRNLWGGKIIGLDPELQVHCYRKGHFFGTRLDKEKRINLTVNNEKKKAKKSWTLLLYLTCPGKGYQGGKTVFLSGKTRGDSAEELQVEFKIGTLLMFRRGQHGLQHKDYEVDEGEKWIVEIDLCVGE